ncbi:MAG: hypothetical protein OXP66_15160 [Candidatus Tectomicrobia bacterium]|nr:hypothetical protein [Candidatus Tectomicrobia bacterium]
MTGLAVLLAAALLGSPSSSWAQEEQDPAAMALDEAIADLEAATPTSAPPTQGAGSPQRPPRRGPQLRLIDVALDVMFYGGFSTENDESISTLQGGSHDPKSRGYTLGQAELSLSGVVDPYFTAAAHILSLVNTATGESTFEVEEAFLTTTGLPLGLQLEAGYFLTEFGIINAQHPHSWDWIDMPVVNSRMFGGDGMRQGGFRASWLLNTPWFSQIHFGMQNANGVTMASFLGGELVHAHGGGGHDDHGHGGEGDAHGAHGGETHDAHGEDAHGHEEEMEDHHGHDHGEEMHAEDEHGDEDAHGHEAEGGPGIGGRPIIAQDVRKLQDFVYLMRWENSFDLSDNITALFGFSGLLGPNSTGRAGSTWLYGFDMKWRWQPADSFRGYPFLTWQTEFMRREYEAAAAAMEVTEADGHVDTMVFPADTLEDWGVYTQLLYGPVINWAVGMRIEYADGRGIGYGHGGRDGDPFRNERYRVSPLVSWRTSEFFRLRLQYNYDNATHLEDYAHTVWLGFEWLYGAHPAHRF